MFTGIIESVGRIISKKAHGKGFVLEIDTGFDLAADALGDSVAVNGVCLTITGKKGSIFAADASAETVSRSTLGDMRPGASVNIERALTLSSRLGGHIVLGHVDAVGRILSRDHAGESVRIRVGFDGSFARYVVEKGSIAIDGVSLTVNEVQADAFAVNIIPHTAQSTSLTLKSAGDRVNLEFDVLGKYVENLLNKDKGTSLKDLLAKQGFLKRE
ncbi:MAG TPA: riboflavin synthase [Deltaproteobacteria bacterium]|nr:riboflavin synthase [Deltaproteobacteria bacterium]HPR54584.1 riboflavin synthase [Deltaproteobacteria bacterium]HXK48014.1 riboflavin synthase [Deltaproteobacteria bacterium]